MKRVSILLISLLLSGCASIDTIMPVSDGFHDRLPDNQARLVVWGNHAGAVSTATNWLRQHGYQIVERARLIQVLEEQHIALTHTAEDHARLLQVGKTLEAQQVVFLETNQTKDPMDDRKEGSQGKEANGYALYNLVVSLRGLDSKTAELQWSGTAYYPGGVQNPNDGIRHLTRSALANAWR